MGGWVGGEMEGEEEWVGGWVGGRRYLDRAREETRRGGVGGCESEMEEGGTCVFFSYTSSSSSSSSCPVWEGEVEGEEEALIQMA